MVWSSHKSGCGATAYPPYSFSQGIPYDRKAKAWNEIKR